MYCRAPDRGGHLARLLGRRTDGIFIAPFELGEIGPYHFRAACNMGLKVWSLSTAIGHTGQGGRPMG
jgi:hypothetical protein